MSHIPNNARLNALIANGSKIIAPTRVRNSGVGICWSEFRFRTLPLARTLYCFIPEQQGIKWKLRLRPNARNCYSSPFPLFFFQRWIFLFLYFIKYFYALFFLRLNFGLVRLLTRVCVRKRFQLFFLKISFRNAHRRRLRHGHKLQKYTNLE